MIEQTAQVVSNEVKFNENVARVSLTSFAASPEAGVRMDTFTRVFPRRQDKTLAERVSEAYKNKLEPEEKELLDRAAEQVGRRLSGQE